jgi:peptide/nickel transport system substrate-binding protein
MEDFHKEGVKFHDGTPQNADAVIYSLNRVLDDNNTRKGEYDFIESISKYSDSRSHKNKFYIGTHHSNLTDPVTS